jgi:Kef-type K+ transport system membrane component KefB
MTEGPQALTLLILLVGATVVVAALTGAALGRVGMPSIVGSILVGLALSAADHWWGLLAGSPREGFRFLAEAGLVVLLFRIGLESDLPALLGQLRRAATIWVSDVGTSAVVGFLTARVLVGFELLPSLFVAAAFSATSVGISTGAWREHDALHTPSGALLLDLAELDDISGIMLMTLLFALVPVLRGTGGSETAILPQVATAAGWLVLKFVSFVALCLGFSRYLERRLTGWFRRLDPSAGPVLLVVGSGFVIAAIAALLGFSLAIGALFAGLAFSRDPQEASIDRAFDSLYRFLAPFFFIGIGIGIDVTALGTGLSLGLLLLAVAVTVKVLGVGLPTMAIAGWGTGIVLGVSMIPRAEIALIVMQRGQTMAGGIVSPELFAGMVTVTIGTCIAAPLAIGPLLRRYPQQEEGGTQ